MIQTVANTKHMSNVEFVRHLMTLLRVTYTFPTETDETAEPITPVVNHGRWLIDCPFCKAAMLADDRDPRFFCVECGNETNGRRWLPVVWPDNRSDIEDSLAALPLQHRNWP